MGKRHPSLTVAVRQKLETMLALGESRQAAKRDARAAGAHFWSFSTGKIHSITTLETYKDNAYRFARWARAEHGIHRLDALEERATELVPAYLQALLAAGKSPYSLQTARSALRMLFQNRTLGDVVAIPRRRREAITRSRGVAVRDADFNPALHKPLLDFLAATGLRRREVTALHVGNVHEVHGHLEVEVTNGKGGKVRWVPVLPGAEAAVRAVVTGRPPEERVFARVSGKIDIHSYRRQYAQALYCAYARRDLPPTDRRLRPADYDTAAVLVVSQALGHNRLDVVLRHYLR
jgi:integrase